jgi:UDP-sulfoquinovose synthase
MRIAILGGDGFVGWPTSLHLSARGHEVRILDNLSRRLIDAELGAQSLTPIATPEERLRAWREAAGAGREIGLDRVDIARDYEGLRAWLAGWRPDAVVHFAEQRAAPYSMKSQHHKRYTVDNNVSGTHNLLCALVELGLEDTHLVHLGTMGVYGYGAVGVPIPEGYLPVGIEAADGRTVGQEILYPANPGSVYHLTKCLDQLLFQFYARNDRLRITDLHQGVVWGTNTAETSLDERLVNRFDYDGDYGTVLNRFLMQAAIGYPLTVHGTGGQTRAFIHVRDSVRCVELALLNPPARGERVKVFNQMTETHRVRDLARVVSRLTGAPVAELPNPRNEAAENDLVVRNDQFLALGLEPTTLEDRSARRGGRGGAPLPAPGRRVAHPLRLGLDARDRRPARPGTGRRRCLAACGPTSPSSRTRTTAWAPWPWRARSSGPVRASRSSYSPRPAPVGLGELEAEGCRIVEAAPLPLSTAFRERHARAALHGAAPFAKGEKPAFHDPLDNFAKLRLWELAEYERVVFLDADTIVVRNIDRLLDYPEFCAAPNLYETLGDFHRLNSGVFVAEPNAATFERMLERLDAPGRLLAPHRPDVPRAFLARLARSALRLQHAPVRLLQPARALALAADPSGPLPVRETLAGPAPEAGPARAGDRSLVADAGGPRAAGRVARAGAGLNRRARRGHRGHRLRRPLRRRRTAGARRGRARPGPPRRRPRRLPGPALLDRGRPAAPRRSGDAGRGCRRRRPRRLRAPARPLPRRRGR